MQLKNIAQASAGNREANTTVKLKYCLRKFEIRCKYATPFEPPFSLKNQRILQLLHKYAKKPGGEVSKYATNPIANSVAVLGCVLGDWVSGCGGLGWGGHSRKHTATPRKCILSISNAFYFQRSTCPRPHDSPAIQSKCMAFTCEPEGSIDI